MIRQDAETRQRERDLKAELRALQKPAKEAARLERKAREKARPKREKRVEHKPDPVKANRGRVRDNAYLAYLRRQPCCVGPLMHDPCEGRTDPAHLRFTDRSVGRVNPGMGRKSDDRWCLPVCRKHHDAQHAYGNEAKWWAQVVKADPNALAAAFYADFQSQGKAA